MLSARELHGIVAMMPAFATEDAADLHATATVDVDNLTAGVDRIIRDGIDAIATTGSFGTRSIFNGHPRQPHGGTDFISPTGTPIHAPNSGRVVVASELYFTGNTVVIDHGLGVFSMLAHLSVMDVHVGDSVIAGQIVGQVGATGRVTGPHLHWAVRVGGARVDPLAVLAILGQPP